MGHKHLTKIGVYDKEKDEYVCPEGKSLIFFAKYFDKTKVVQKNKLANFIM